MMKTLGVHDKADGDFVENLKSAAGGCELEVVERKPAALYGCDIAVVHCLDNEWDDLLNHSADRSVRLRVSTAGFRTRMPTLRGSVFELHLVPQSFTVVTEAWVEILKGLKSQEVVEAIVLRSAGDLAHYFLPRQELLAALSLLCQGHLVVHVDMAGSSSEIARGLAAMGWNLVFKGRNRGADWHLGRDVRPQKERVRRPGWWLEPFGLLNDDPERWNGFREELSAEWGGRLPCEVEALLDQLSPPRQSVDDPSAVAGAFRKVFAHHAYRCLHDAKNKPGSGPAWLTLLMQEILVPLVVLGYLGEEDLGCLHGCAALPTWNKETRTTQVPGHLNDICGRLRDRME